MAKDGRDIPIKMCIMEIFIMERPMAKESIFGLMGKFMMASGRRVLNMGMVYGKVVRAILMLVNGNSHKLMDMVSIFGQMETGMKENGSKV